MSMSDRQFAAAHDRYLNPPDEVEEGDEAREQREADEAEACRIADLQKTAPERIYLQIDPDALYFQENEDTTWSAERINDSDVVYIRRDLVKYKQPAETTGSAEHEELETLRAAVKPFARLVSETSGRIPTEHLSFAHWQALAKAVKVKA